MKLRINETLTQENTYIEKWQNSIISDSGEAIPFDKQSRRKKIASEGKRYFLVRRQICLDTANAALQIGLKESKLMSLIDFFDDKFKASFRRYYVRKDGTNIAEIDKMINDFFIFGNGLESDSLKQIFLKNIYKDVIEINNTSWIWDASKALFKTKFEERKQSSVSHTNVNIFLGSYTNSQLTLIFYYFFKLNRLEVRKDIDIAPVAKFLHLITGKKFTTTANSDFYKKLSSAPNFIKDKKLIQDLEATKPLFQEVELGQIVKMIDNEIATAKSELARQH